jgi:Chaperone of endosialidase
MVTTPFGLESSNQAELWNLNIDASGDLHFNANSNAGGGNTRMTIGDNSGGVTIKTDNDGPWAITIRNALSTSHQTGMYVSNDGFFRITNTISNFPNGLAQLDSTGRWSIQSDFKMKRDVEAASGLLEKALSLNPINFYYEKQDLETMPHKLTGFIAQEVETVFPQLVTGTDIKFLDYNGLISVAIGALKEMKQSYDAKIADLEMQLAQLKKMVLAEEKK